MNTVPVIWDWDRTVAAKGRGSEVVLGNTVLGPELLPSHPLVALRCILREIARAAAQKKQTQFGPLKRALRIRHGGFRAIVAVAHKILQVVYAMLRDGTFYVDPEIDYNALVACRNGPR